MTGCPFQGLPPVTVPEARPHPVPDPAAQPDGDRSALVLAGAVPVALVLAVLAAFTRPFTWPADLVVSAGYGALLALVVSQRTAPGLPGVLRRRPSRARPGQERPWRARWALWVVPLGAVIAWEVLCYVGAPRSAHPTFSSMLDSVDASRLGHGTTFAVWLAFGWYLVTR